MISEFSDHLLRFARVKDRIENRLFPRTLGQAG